MMIARLNECVRLVAPFIVPTAAGALWTWLSFVGGYQAGWTAFQNPASQMADGRPFDYVAVQILVAVSFALIAFGRRLAALCLASALFVLGAITWLGSIG
jgi:hypothetical protein